MDYAELLQRVQAAAALDRATAERVLWATMVTLAERMSHDELARLGTLEREVAGTEMVRQRLPREFEALMA